MNAKEFAAMLNGREYRQEITKAEAHQAEHAGLIVAFGASDDNLELRGAMDDELSAYDGADVKIRLDSLRVVECDTCKECGSRSEVFGIKAQWAPSNPDASWLITASGLPFEPFDIMEDGALYCRGAVIALPRRNTHDTGKPVTEGGV